MKRRDFLKLPALIPGLKKLVDDLTLPDEPSIKEEWLAERILPEETPTTSFLKKSLEYPDAASSFSLSWPTVFLNDERHSLYSSSVSRIADAFPPYAMIPKRYIYRGYEIKMTIIGACPSFEGTTDVKIIHQDTYTQFEMTDPYIVIEHSSDMMTYTDISCMVEEVHTGMV